VEESSADGEGRRLWYRPVDRANLTVLVNVLEGLHEAKSLVDAATDRSVVQGGLHKNALRIDDEETTVGVAGLFHQNVVLARNALGQISHERNLKGATEATLLTRGVDPGQMRVLGINGHTDHFAVVCATPTHKKIG
jgi:hypothetical protein